MQSLLVSYGDKLIHELIIMLMDTHTLKKYLQKRIKTIFCIIKVLNCHGITRKCVKHDEKLFTCARKILLVLLSIYPRKKEK